jgi:hypothetical protein
MTNLATLPLSGSMALSGETCGPAGKDLVQLVQKLLVFSSTLRVRPAQFGMESCTPIMFVEHLSDVSRMLTVGVEQMVVDLFSHRKAAVMRRGVVDPALLGLGLIF